MRTWPLQDSARAYQAVIDGSAGIKQVLLPAGREVRLPEFRHTTFADPEGNSFDLVTWQVQPAEKTRCEWPASDVWLIGHQSREERTRMSLPTPTLHTARLRLRPFGDADANDLFVLHSNAYVLRYWDAPPWSERVRAERFITACRQMAEEGTGARLAVDRLCDGAFIGWCSLNRWNPDYRSASLGYCFDDAAWGHGYATEAARGLLRWAFDTLDLNRVQAETDTRNMASARVLEKLGFVREGTLREDCVVNGEVSDSWVYGLIRREWRPSSEPLPAR